jgi:hypothetical protein
VDVSPLPRVPSARVRPRQSWRVLPAFAALCGLSVCACGASGQSSAPSAITGITTRLRTAPADLGPTKHGPQVRRPGVGAAQSIRAPGTTLIVRITSVVDPLRGSRAAVPPGMTAVGVLASVKDSGPAGYDGSDTSNFSLRSESGTASPVFVPSGICETDVQDFMNEIGPGETRSGCIAFAVPSGQRPLSVGFTPNQANSHMSRTWFMTPR